MFLKHKKTTQKQLNLNGNLSLMFLEHIFFLAGIIFFYYKKH